MLVFIEQLQGERLPLASLKIRAERLDPSDLSQHENSIRTMLTLAINSFCKIPWRDSDVSLLSLSEWNHQKVLMFSAAVV